MEEFGLGYVAVAYGFIAVFMGGYAIVVGVKLRATLASLTKESPEEAPGPLLGKIFLAALPVTLLLIAGSAYMILSFAPLEAVMGWPQKIFYYHVPIAVITYVGFFITLVGSIGFLWTRKLVWDRWAATGAEVGVLLASLMLITGMMWGKPIWGVYWTWDPRLTTSLVLWLIFVGYLILRGQVTDEVSRAKYAAVVGIVGYVDVPIVHWSVKLWSRGIHPPRPELHPDMKTTLLYCFVTVALIFVTLFVLRLRYEFAKAGAHRAVVSGNG